MDKWSQLASQESVDKTIAALKENGIDAQFVQTKDEAKKKFFEILPVGAEVMNMTSITLDTLGIPQEILESGKYNAIRNQYKNMDRATQGSQMQKLGAGPDWAVGSVHAVTENGEVLIASQTGSQLSAYAAGASNVIWVVGTQKIVKNLDEAMKRIYEHCLPLEAERANKAYNITTGSSVNKILIIKKEKKIRRINLIFVPEVLGF